MGSGPAWQAAHCSSSWLPHSQAPRPHAGVPAAQPHVGAHEPDPGRAWQAKAWILELKHGGDTKFTGSLWAAGTRAHPPEPLAQTSEVEKTWHSVR